MRSTAQNRVLVIQHTACEGLGLYERTLREMKVSAEYIQPALGQPLPNSLSEYCALIILGGPMAVYEKSRVTHLRDELQLIEQALHANLPLLGICLGCQLLCAALGGDVAPGSRKEIGWYEVELTPAARQEVFFNAYPARFLAFHWHGDQCKLPAYSTLLASSAITPVQAFSYGVNALGIQFHPEVDRETVTAMCETFAAELATEKINPVGLLGGAELHLQSMEKLSRDAFSNWWQSALNTEPLIFEHGEPASD
jgi:GMP synthase (glutamine-hydrolysing)